MDLDLMKKQHFKFVLSVTLKAFVVETWNCMDVLFGVWIFAPGYFQPAKIYIYGVMGLDLVKNLHFWQSTSGGICVLWTHFLVFNWKEAPIV